VSVATIRPCKVKYWSEDLHAHILHTYAHQAVCPCGYAGPIRRTHVDAVNDRRAHSCPPVDGKES
jgi:hypothetical protein